MTAALKQPRGFRVFCATEMWERYGFYIVQYTLALLLLNTYQLQDAHIYAIMGSFTALVYLSPVVGGYLADKILGYGHAIVLGCVTLIAGYGLLATWQGLPMVYFALSIIAVGTGLVKSSMSAFLGAQYHDESKGHQDVRRHQGFSIFYAVLNLGEVLAAVSAGYLTQIWGWDAVYVTAALGLFLGTLIFSLGIKLLKLRDNRQRTAGVLSIVVAYVTLFILVAVNDQILGNQTLAWALMAVVLTGAIVLVIAKGRQCSVNEQKKLAVFFVLALLSAVFWALFFLIYSALNLYIVRVINHHFLGINLPITLYAGIESLGVVILGPLMGLMWLRLKMNGRDLSTPGKSSLGFGLMGLTMLILYVSTAMAHGGLVASSWLILAYFVLAAGELALSAIGLAMVTEYVPRHLTGMMMGVWFICTGIGGKLSGLFADATAIPDSVHNLARMESIYDHAFMLYAIVALATAAMVMIIMKLRKLIPSARTRAS